MAVQSIAVFLYGGVDWIENCIQKTSIMGKNAAKITFHQSIGRFVIHVKKSAKG